MDDLDYSVQIAEQDWESFYEDSEECSIQQAGLAGLDDSGFSDTDDEKNSIQETVLPSQAKSDKPINECGAAPHATNEADECVADHLKYSEGFSNKPDTDISAEQTAKISLTTTSVCLTSDSNIDGNVIIPNDQEQNASETENLRQLDESCSEDKLDQAVGEPITSSSCIQDTGNCSTEGNTILKVTDSSENPKKEKERWFVTVNYSPVRLRVNHGTSSQKKGKKKKSSRMLVEQSTAMEQQCSLVNFKEAPDEEIQERKHELKQQHFNCMCFNTHPNNINEDVTSDSSSNKENVLEESEDNEKICIPKIICTSESFTGKDENTVGPFSFESEGTSGVPTKIFENNSSASLIDPFLFNHTDTQQLPTNKQHIASQPNITIPVPPEPNTLSNVNDEPLDSLIKTFSSTAPLENTEQEPPTQSRTEDKIFFIEETPNQKPPDKDLEAAVGPVCPVYALSSFWDEMEKLTINDILHIRSADNRTPLGGSVTPEDVHLDDKNLLRIQDSSLMDDGADSGYFTNVEDSKPGHLSCEFSTLSDFDEELLQIPNPSATPSPEPQNFKEHTEMFVSPSPEPQNFKEHSEMFESPSPEPQNFKEHSKMFESPSPEPQNLKAHSEIFESPSPEPQNFKEHTEMFESPSPEPQNFKEHSEMFESPSPEPQNFKEHSEMFESPSPEPQNFKEHSKMFESPSPEPQNLKEHSEMFESPSPEPQNFIEHSEMFESPSPEPQNFKEHSEMFESPSPEPQNFKEHSEMFESPSPEPQNFIEHSEMFESPSPEPQNFIEHSEMFESPSPEPQNFKEHSEMFESPSPEPQNFIEHSEMFESPSPEPQNFKAHSKMFESPSPKPQNFKEHSEMFESPSPEPQNFIEHSEMFESPSPEPQNFKEHSEMFESPSPEPQNFIEHSEMFESPSPEPQNFKEHTEMFKSPSPEPQNFKEHSEMFESPSPEPQNFKEHTEMFESPSPEPQNFKEHTEMFESTYIPDQKLDLTTIKSDIDLEYNIKLEDGIPLYLYPDVEPQSLPLTLNLDNSLYELDSNRTPAVLAVSNMLNDQYFLTLSDELQTRSPQISVVSFPHSQNLSVVETYDDFFSDFEVGNLFFPPVPDTTVPIFSSSRSVVNDYIETDLGENNLPIPVITRLSSQLEMDTSVSGTPNICLFTSQRKNWRSLLSLRRIGFTGKGSTWYQRVSSWMFPKEAATSISYVTESKQVIPLLQVDEQQRHPQHSVLIPKKDNFIFTIKQADMCLVCIAFASWVLKSSNPQSTDTWKAALLANVSAISAIQYLRKHVKKENNW